MYLNFKSNLTYLLSFLAVTSTVFNRHVVELFHSRKQKSEKMKPAAKETHQIDEVDCDVSTVKNQRIKRDNEDRKQTRSQSSKSKQFSKTPNKCDSQFKENTPEESTDRLEKVTDWLENSCVLPENKAIEENEVSEWMLESESPEVAEWIISNKRRVRVILLSVSPSIDGEPLDLVCGYCSEGHEHFTFTKLHWEKSEGLAGSEMVPYCPSCLAMGHKLTVILFFMITLFVIDAKGSSVPIFAYKDFAEQFLGCTTKEFVENSEVRKSKIQLLRNLIQFEEVSYIPQLDISIAISNEKAHLVSGRLIELI